MSFLMMLAFGHSAVASTPSPSPTPTPTTYTKTFTSNASFPVPAGVSVLKSAVGKGAAGSTSQSTTNQSAQVSEVLFYHTLSGGAVSGALTWDFFTDAATIASNISKGGSGQQAGPKYTGYGGDNTYSLNPEYTVTWSNAVPGSASASYSSQWQMSGQIGSSTSDVAAIASVSWQEYGGTVSTTGASSTGFGKVFPGGTGGAATDTTFTNIAVTAGATYNVVVPPGGYITITWEA